MRSTQEREPSLREIRDDPEILSGMEVEAEVSESLRKTSSVDSKLSYADPGIQTWESKNPVTWSASAWLAEIQDPVIRAAKAQAWETQAFEAQARAIQPKPSSVLEVVATASVLKQKPLKEKVTKEKRDVVLTRPQWPNKTQYLLTQLGYSLTPSNLLRFISLWLTKGGCIFLFIYLLVLFFIGIPLLFLEMAVGQRLNQASMGLWKIVGPWAGGVGFASLMVCSICSTYVNVVSAWMFFYLSHSFQIPVPWEKCPLMKNSSDYDPECTQTTPSMYFWYRQTLSVSVSIEDSGPPVLSLSLPFFVCWCFVAAFMIRGLKSIGKAMYGMVLLTYIIIICFIFRGFLLEGATYGLQQLLITKISALYNINVWALAVSQVLYDLGLGIGPIAAFSSHMPQSNNCLIDAFVLALVNIGTSLLVTIFILEFLGCWSTVLTHRCSEKNVETLLKLVNLGELPPEAQPPASLLGNPTSIYNTWLSSLPGSIKSMILSKVPECSTRKQFIKVIRGSRFSFLAFVEVTSFIPGSVLWSALFFVFLLVLELSTAVGLMQGIIIPLQDTFSSLRKHTKLFTVSICTFMFLCGLLFTQPSGFYLMSLLNESWIILSVFIIVICENITIAWAYGAKRLLADLMVLLNRPISPICSWIWCCMSPITMLVLFATILFRLFTKPFTYVAWDSSKSKEVTRYYPSWGLLLMIILLLIVLLPIPIYFIYCLIHRIPFRSKNEDRLMIYSKFQSLSGQLTPSKEVQKEEVLQDDKTKC